MNDAAMQECREAIRLAQETVADLLEEDPDFAALMQGRSFAIELIDDWGDGAATKARVNSDGDPEWV